MGSSDREPTVSNTGLIEFSNSHLTQGYTLKDSETSSEAGSADTVKDSGKTGNAMLRGLVEDNVTIESNVTNEQQNNESTEAKQRSAASNAELPNISNFKSKANSTSRHPLSAKKQVDSDSVVDQERRTSAQVKDRQLKEKLSGELNEAIDLQMEVNRLLLEELKTKPTFNTITNIKVDLENSMKYIHSLHDKFKQHHIEPDKALTIQVDRFTHDNQFLSR